LPQADAAACYIVSTGHGTSGPFHFAGVTLPTLLAAYDVTNWQHVDVISADNFGTRVYHREFGAEQLPNARPILLALRCNGQPLTRIQGLVRLIVPTETDDALRQVKWVMRLEVH
jgi:DMSO/TMAO reductase YedYZ molybdopterin-dependent catalytic subunit